MKKLQCFIIFLITMLILCACTLNNKSHEGFRYTFPGYIVVMENGCQSERYLELSEKRTYSDSIEMDSSYFTVKEDASFYPGGEKYYLDRDRYYVKYACAYIDSNFTQAISSIKDYVKIEEVVLNVGYFADEYSYETIQEGVTEPLKIYIKDSDITSIDVRKWSCTIYDPFGNVLCETKYEFGQDTDNRSSNYLNFYYGDGIENFADFGDSTHYVDWLYTDAAGTEKVELPISKETVGYNYPFKLYTPKLYECSDRSYFSNDFAKIKASIPDSVTEVIVPSPLAVAGTHYSGTDSHSFETFSMNQKSSTLRKITIPERYTDIYNISDGTSDLEINLPASIRRIGEIYGELKAVDNAKNTETYHTCASGSLVVNYPGTKDMWKSNVGLCLGDQYSYTTTNKFFGGGSLQVYHLPECYLSLPDGAKVVCSDGTITYHEVFSEQFMYSDYYRPDFSLSITEE